VWSAKFIEITELLESLGWNIRGTPYFRTLDACRLVVNVYKHGEGKARDDLQLSYPEYLADPFNRFRGELAEIWRGHIKLNHTHLRVNDEQIQTFADAIVAFWKDVPENTFESKVISVPNWFEKAILNDRCAEKQVNKK
jgi:hypothetical protein